MSCQESLDYLYGLQKFGIKLGLENIRTFLSRLGHPEHNFKSILVAGTNGKGSIATALAGILNRAGYRTGLYTSPHLHRFNERIRVDNEPVPDVCIAQMVAKMRPQSESIPLTFFEFTTALALQYFADQDVDVAVLEVGLGGRFDATNAIEPILSIITPIAKDHQRYLGNSLEQIAREKAGIMRPGVPVVASCQSQEVAASLQVEAERVGTDITFAPDVSDAADHGNSFDYCGLKTNLPELQPGIPGKHQFGNMATALVAAELLRKADWPITPEIMRAGVENVCWPGRLEWLDKKTILLDGAHNGAGATALAAYLADQKINNAHWIVGLKADKNSEEIIAPLAAHAAAVYCVEPPVEEAVPLAVLQEVASRHGCPSRLFNSPEEALLQARAAAGEDGVILVAGSLFLVAAIREIVMHKPGSH